MEPVYRLVRGKKEESVSLLTPASAEVWKVVRDGSDFRAGDVVCSRNPIAAHRAARRVAAWRTRVAPSELVMLRPVEGWRDGKCDIVAPYARLLPFLVPIRPVGGPPPAA